MKQELNLLTETSIKSDEGYCKLPDGTLMCFGNETIITKINSIWGNLWYGSKTKTISFGMPFISPPAISFNTTCTSVASITCCEYDKSKLSSITVYAGAKYDQETTVNFSFTAIGRWK